MVSITMTRDADEWYKKGLALLQKGKPEKALECFEKILQVDPNHLGALNNKIQIDLQLGHRAESLLEAGFDEVLKGLDRIESLSKEEWRSRTKDATEFLNEFIQAHPGDSKAWADKGVLLGTLGKLEEAVRSFDKSIEVHYKKSQDLPLGKLNSKSELLHNMGEYGQELECFEKILVPVWGNWKIMVMVEQNCNIMARKARILQAMGEYKRALQCVNHRLEMDPANEEFIGRRELLKKLIERDELLRRYNPPTRKNIEVALRKYQEGMGLHRLMKHAPALECYNETLRVLPYHAGVLLNKGISLHFIGKKKEGIEYIEKASKYNPDLIETWAKLGQALFEESRYNESLKCWDFLLSQEPSISIFWDKKAKTLYQLERFKEALNCIERGLHLEPENKGLQALQNEISIKMGKLK